MLPARISPCIPEGAVHTGLDPFIICLEELTPDLGAIYVLFFSSSLAHSECRCLGFIHKMCEVWPIPVLDPDKIQARWFPIPEKPLQMIAT